MNRFWGWINHRLESPESGDRRSLSCSRCCKRCKTRDSSHRGKETGHDEAKKAASWPQPGRYGNRRYGRTAGVGTALDPATGKILWQTPDPQGAVDASFVSTANGVVYAGSMAAAGTNMYALDAATGKILWSFASGSPAAAIALGET